MVKSKSRIFFMANLFLFLILTGMTISFFVFNAEKNSDSYEVQAKEKSYKNTASYAGDDMSAAYGVQNALRKIARENMKAVVSIATETVVEMRNPYEEFFGEEFYRQFFGSEAPRRKHKQHGLGSGFIVDEDGYLLSNLHVVKNATKIKVYLHDEETEYEAEVIGVDEFSDLALLKIKADRKFPYVELGDSEDIEMGDLAIAIGNPYGLNNTMTMGIVSAKARSEVAAANRFQRFIQVDVAINPGNSGGPLFNIEGEVIGVNSMIYSTSGGNIGIGFAIPINLAKRVMRQLREDGKVSRGYLGVYIQDIDETLAKGLGVDPYIGVFVSKVVEDTPADKAGIKEGDIIIEFDGKEMNKANDLYYNVESMKIGEKADVVILRDGDKEELEVEIEERPSAGSKQSYKEKEAQKTAKEWYGIEVANLDEHTRRELGLRDGEKGVVITSVEPYSAAGRVGVKKNDVIQKIDGVKIEDLDDYTDFMKDNDEEKNTFLIKRGYTMFAVTLYKNNN